MDTHKKRHELRGGNSVGFIRNGVLYSDSDSGCLRRILMRDADIEPNRENISHQTANVFALGHKNEEFFVKDFAELLGTDYVLEQAVVDPITDDVDFVGHSDVVIPALPFELKSCTSKNTYKKVFVELEPKTDNAVQLVNYMLALEKQEGKLVYTSYTDVMEYKELADYTWEQVEELAHISDRESIVYDFKINDDGVLDLNGKPFNVTLSEILEFRNRAAECLTKQIVYLDRPAQLKEGFFNACSGCVFRSICDNFEETRCSTEVFLQQCKELIAHE